ncbi:MAG: DNA polymerase III, subunit gamma and tau [Candidatus Andersenbacteria bacterium RIFCSPHIGHO2_02_FULL_45_11]|uniref:DNA polymerase III subunit gamma/tau n=1 Tax=Candidatus Andersenbacteria bacterium RIFCSPHIGHO2_12_FULL_45_11 TaxID=1797281 RepID=A0A1G1X1X9_9BACT|nr:MAG: DNA polymerase III, subunit gamma and tau [Candidatus Andersenbacteria bacterium RIFCSPHIGHO2_01_FULL_46_36]OGY33964.1 MAG: DNA polymerase III, subunit gamma and tau [Candidatus Andersenbacteria bacterium RIFCSPHIGHO2_12_FULL_45_11]OGY34531.1 MAG: DNA polymerase III, subunit gamma and tau [Candidatus Andersenbacteria bacterium RIFCSPHIGHO2_02_FULL_45_11]
MPALYRQYRPTTFAEIIGQDHITSILMQQVIKDAIAHAYLFQGPRGTGKTTTARVFAKRINCSAASTAESCGTCTSCVALQDHRALDVIEIDAASNRGIDDIRALRDTATLSPTLGKYKVYIIDEVHQLSGPAFAALLKILEEPPKHVLFILATTELQKVPATIASRCQLFRFKRATHEEMHARIQHLLAKEDRTADEELISFIISRSDGCYRDAESLLGQLLSQSEDTLTVQAASGLLGIPSPQLIENFLTALIASDTATAITIATKAYTDGFDVEQFLHEAIRQARDTAVQAVTTGNGQIDRLTTIMRAFLVATQDLAYVPEPMIAIELAILTACVSSAKPPVSPPHMRGSQSAEMQTGGGSGVERTTTPPLPAKQAVPLPSYEGRKSSTPNSPPNAQPDERLTKIRSSWEAIIQHVRTLNPVASTFLRATSPHIMNENVLTIRMQFPLHKTFFDKPDNKLKVQQAIKAIVDMDVALTCLLESNATGPAVTREQKELQEADLLKNVQEVFGVQVK